jgi:hypothetical protein
MLQCCLLYHPLCLIEKKVRNYPVLAQKMRHVIGAGTTFPYVKQSQHFCCTLFSHVVLLAQTNVKAKPLLQLFLQNECTHGLL